LSLKNFILRSSKSGGCQGDFFWFGVVF